MNKTKKITKDNIDDIKILMKKLLCYFDRWRNKVVKIKNMQMGKEMVKHIHVKHNLYESKTWNCRFLKICKNSSCPTKPTKLRSVSSFKHIIIRSSFFFNVKV